MPRRQLRTLVWPNGADFDPASLHDWHKGDGAELAERAKHWKMPDPATLAVTEKQHSAPLRPVFAY